MDEEKTVDGREVESNPKPSGNLLLQTNDAAHLKSISSKDNSDSLVSTESILSTINEECQKISSKEKENGMKSDSESSFDMVDKENSLDNSSIKDKEKELQEASENGQSSLSSNTNDQTYSQDPSVDPVAIPETETYSHDSPVDEVSVPKTKINDEESSTDPVLASETENNFQDSSENQVSVFETKTDSLNSSIDSISVVEKTNSDVSTDVSSLKEKVLNSEHTENNEAKEISDTETDTNQKYNTENTTYEPDIISTPNDFGEDDEVISECKDDDVISECKDDDVISECKDDEVSEKGESGKIKIKLRSFASLCESDTQKEGNLDKEFEVSGVAVGDIVQHSNIVESDECGVMHLKISNVVGGEDCITGLSMDDGGDLSFPIQISSITSLIEPLSPDEGRIDKMNMSSHNAQGSTTSLAQLEVESTAGKAVSLSESDIANNKEVASNDLVAEMENPLETIVNIFRSPLVVGNACCHCKKKVVCEFRIVSRKYSETKVSFICSTKCKNNAIANLPDTQVVQKPRLYFERVCGMCGKDISSIPKSNLLSWQTREFCNKLCLADHIGEVGRVCYYCKSAVRVLYMVKYCVRFGSDVHQFCCNTCLETYKTTIKVCSFCQKNLNSINKVISPSNKEYCSNKCLKRAQRRDIGQINYKEENECIVCQKKRVNIYEFIHNGIPTFLCSTPCLNVFKYVNHVKSVNCCLCARLLNAEDTSNYFFNGKQLRVFCSESCFSVFVISARKIVTCYYCKVKKYNFDMISTTFSDEIGECFCCSVCCLNFVESQNKISHGGAVLSETESSLASKNESAVVVSSAPTDSSTATAVSSTPILKNCNMCSKLEPAQFHMVMSDSTLRSFCSYQCATRYKCTFGFQVSGGIQTIDKMDEDALQAKDSQTTETQTGVQSGNSAGNKKIDLKDSKSLKWMFFPPLMCNKNTMCKPFQNTKGVQCKPHQWHKSSQTDDETRAIIPVPIPVYVPTPMMMYSAPTPVPLVIPVPVPIPVFIPTSEKTTEDLEQRIKSILASFPSDPAQAKVTAPATDEEEKTGKKRKYAEDEECEEPPAEDDKIEANENAAADAQETELELISKIEVSLPKYNVELENNLNALETPKRKSDSEGNNSAKRRKVDEEEEEEEEEEKEEETEYLDLLLGLSVWHAWIQRKAKEEEEEAADEGQGQESPLHEDLSTMTSEVLSQSLILFLDELSAQATQFDADTIFYILLGLQKYLFEKGSTHCIFLEINFDRFTSTFDEIVERFFSTAAQLDTKCLDGTRVTEEMLWEARQLGAHTPHVLINTLFYFNTKIFKLKKPDDHLNLSFNRILKEGKRASNLPDGSPVLTMYLKFSQDEKVEDNSAAAAAAQPLLMYENKENPLRCPVKLYEFYLSKCPLPLRTAKDTYYVYPERTCLPDSAVWYSRDALDVATIGKMLNRILLVREVQEALFEEPRG